MKLFAGLPRAAFIVCAGQGATAQTGGGVVTLRRRFPSDAI
jgi:hypothetical protein